MNESNEQPIQPVVHRLGKIAVCQSRDDLERIFKKKIHSTVQFSRCYVVEAENGDLATGQIGGIVNAWWEVSIKNAYRIKKAKSLETLDAEIFAVPMLKLYIENNAFLLGECYGRRLICRRTGQLADLYSCSSFEDFRMIWASVGSG